MTGRAVDGIEQAVFGEVTEDEVDDWLARHVRRRLGLDVQQVLFRAGRVDAVYGLLVGDGTSIVAKVHRDPVDVAALSTAVSCQRHLAAAGYPCPLPLDGPARTAGRVAVLESLLSAGLAGDSHEPATRAALAASLATHVELLRAVPGAAAGLTDPPAWAVYHQGPWPTPHDPIFDFTTTPPGSQWLDALAARAADVLREPPGPVAVGHSDWSCGNVRFSDGRTGATAVVAAYDWDSLVGAPEAVLAGLTAGSYTEGSTSGAAAPTPAEAAAFLVDYDRCRSRPFNGAEQAAAAAATAWVLAYNARCQLSFAGPEPAAGGSALAALSEHGADYLRLRW